MSADETVRVEIPAETEAELVEMQRQADEAAARLDVALRFTLSAMGHRGARVVGAEPGALLVIPAD